MHSLQLANIDSFDLENWLHAISMARGQVLATARQDAIDVLKPNDQGMTARIVFS